ncbi:hypothetical protein N0V95_001847 [Ascochyta clinopodiicola]|nr:hypothetical protein N0V95_001847 [Ascochyta clinopodiicola]
MVAWPSSSSPVQETDSLETSPFVQQIRDIEAFARAEMDYWDTKYLPQVIDPTLGVSQVPAKRKAAEMDPESSDEDEDDNDDSDSDGEVEEIPPHDPNLQTRPKLPIYHPGFQLAEEIAQRILNAFIQYITASIQSGYEDPEAQRLRKDIIRKKTIKYQDAVRLAVAGDTGVGKSALLNALLGVLNLTIESDSGGACTCVITEFRQSKPTQATPFAAEVKFFCLEMCRKLVTDLFSQWFHVKQKQRQDPDEIDDIELSQMSTARDCLQDLFADRLEFGSAEMFMGTATCVNDKKVLNQLLKWTTEIHQQFVKEGETSVHFEASTPETLTELYHPFTRPVPNASFEGKPLRFTPWPLVEIVKVSLNSPILAQDVIIADVPGISDVNYFRVDNAARYLQECNVTIVVAKIDRLQDNAAFRQQYLNAYRRRRSGSVILVATRSDDLNDENGSTLVLDSATESLLASINDSVVEIEKKVRLISNEMDGNRLNKKSKANKPLKKQKKKLMARKNALEKQRKAIRIALRSKQVSRVIGLNYRADTGDDAGAPVFCVSNRMYMRHLRGYDIGNESSIPTMTLEETQIPALISHIFALPSKGRTADLEHFIRVTLQTLLSVIQMSCSASTLTRVKHLTEIVERAREDLDIRINELISKFIKTDIKRLEDELADHDLQSRFDAQATLKLTRWESLNAATHKAICSKKGVHSNKKKGIHMNWNEDLIDPIRPAIDKAFRTILDSSCDTFKAEAAQTLKNALSNLDNTLKSDPQALAADAYRLCFSDNKTRYEQEITRQVDAATKSLRESLIKVHLHTLRVSPDDYFPEAMLEVYSVATATKATRKGTTIMQARCSYLSLNIPGPTGPFASLSGWAEEDARKAMHATGDTLKQEVDDIFVQTQIECAKQLYLNTFFDKAAARGVAENFLNLKVAIRNDWYKLSTEHSIATIARAILASADTITQVLPVRLQYPYDRKAPSTLRALDYYGLVIRCTKDGFDEHKLLPLATKFVGSEPQTVTQHIAGGNKRVVTWPRDEPASIDLFEKLNSEPILRCGDAEVLFLANPDGVYWEIPWAPRRYVYAFDVAPRLETANAVLEPAGRINIRNTFRCTPVQFSKLPTNPFEVVSLDEFSFQSEASILDVVFPTGPNLSEADAQYDEEESSVITTTEEEYLLSMPFDGMRSRSAHSDCPFLPIGSSSPFCSAHHAMVSRGWDILTETRKGQVNGTTRVARLHVHVKDDGYQSAFTTTLRSHNTIVAIRTVRNIYDTHITWVVDVEFCRPNGVQAVPFAISIRDLGTKDIVLSTTVDYNGIDLDDLEDKLGDHQRSYK